jgi:hypothetical protein
MTYITVNNKIFERLEDAQEYERCVSVAMQKTITLRVLMAKMSDLRARRDALEKELAALDITEDAAYAECRKADAATQEAAGKASMHKGTADISEIKIQASDKHGCEWTFHRVAGQQKWHCYPSQSKTGITFNDHIELYKWLPEVFSFAEFCYIVMSVLQGTPRQPKETE